jgi:hypothetical protein
LINRTFTQSLNDSILLPFSCLNHFADFALDQVTFERADVADIQLAVQVIGFVLEGTSQQVFPSVLEDLPSQILGADGHHLRATHIFAEFRNAEAAFTLRVAALLMDDFGIDEDDLGVGVLFERDVNHGDAERHADLRRGQAHTAGGVHRLEHVIDEQLQFAVENGDFVGRLLKDWISELYNGIDHFQSQSVTRNE